jgi:hypothetical protein
MHHVAVGYAADVLEEYAKPIFGVKIVLVRESVQVRWAGSLSDPMMGVVEALYISKHKITPTPTNNPQFSGKYLYRTHLTCAIIRQPMIF